jgi:acyl-CoA dehydrogenase
MKQQMTTRMRLVVNDGMDILGGAGICNGPSNFLANAYCAVPIAITVEGANVLTRSLIQFGQGLTRSHPTLLHMIKAIQHGDDMPGFNKALLDTIKHGGANTYRSLAATVTRRRMKIHSQPVDYYESQLNKLSANFALCSDFAMTMGGSIKAAEFTSGRYADVLSNLFLGYAVLWHYQKYPVAGSEKLVEYAMENILFETEDALFGIYANFPIPLLGGAMRVLTAPTGRCYQRPTDDMVKAVAGLITTDSPVRTQLAESLYFSADPNDRVTLLNTTLPQALAADKLLTQLRKEKRTPSPAEKVIIDTAEAAREIIIQVDSFARVGKEIGQSEDWTSNERPAYTSMAYAEVAAAR